MLPAILFSLLVVLIFHLVKRQLSKPSVVKQETVSQPMPQIRLEKVQTQYAPKFIPKGDSKRIPIPEKLRFEVFKRDRFRCVYCGRSPKDVELRVDYERATLRMLTLFGMEADHFIPVVRGGQNTMDNPVTSCEFCNGGKGDIILAFGFEFFVG